MGRVRGEVKNHQRRGRGGKRISKKKATKTTTTQLQPDKTNREQKQKGFGK